MKKGNKIVVAIIVILIILMLAGGAFAYLYVATDVFKSDRDMFFAYWGQLISEDGFFDKRIEKFYEKKTQSAFENSGEILAEVELPEEIEQEMNSEKIIEKVNNLAIKFSGKVDETNKKIEQDVVIDYGNDVKLPINYKQDGNKFGIKIDELSKKYYIAVKNENLKALAAKFGVVDSVIPNEISFSEITNDVNITDEDIEELQKIYIPILRENLLEENFSKVKNEQNVSYTLELKYEQMKNIFIKMLEATKENTLLIDKINEIMLKEDPEAEKIEVSAIDDIIKEINSEEDTEKENDEGTEETAEIPNIKLTLVQSNKLLNEFRIEAGESIISIKKSNETDGVNYRVNCEINNMESIEEDLGQANLYFNVQYLGLNDIIEVQENYEFGFDISYEDESMKYAYKINSKTEFKDEVDIDDLDSSEAMFLNDYNETEIISFLKQVGTKLLAINKNQMNKLGLKEIENPLLYSNPLTLYLMLSLNVYNNAAESIENANLTKYEKQKFNENFTRYEGTNVSGANVNALIATVQSSNLSTTGTDARLVKVTLDGDEIEQKVNSSNKYNVKAIYDEDDLVIEMRITTNN